MRSFRSEKSKRHVHIGRVDLDSDGAGKGRGVFGFCAAEANCSGDMCLCVWCLMHNEGNKLGDEREVCAIDVDVKVGEKELECEDEELESERAKTVSDPGQPSRRERGGNSRAIQELAHCVRERKRQIATKHFRHAFAHDKMMHTSAIDDSRHKALRRK